MNLIDGLDGLAAGLVAIAAGTFFLYGERLSDVRVLRTGQPRPAAGHRHRQGMCLGFLPHNFHPAKIFMGDGGALLLGLLMAASTIPWAAARASRSAAGVLLRPLFIPCSSSGCRSSTRFSPSSRRATKRAGAAEPTRSTCTTG